MSSIFTKIIKGEIPCHKIAEDDNYFSFLDIRPVNNGHTLVIPKKEVDYIFDLDDKEYTGLLMFSRNIAKAIKKAIPCEKVGVMVAGLEVPHAHVHLVPINSVAELNFSRANPANNEDLRIIADKIRDALK